MRSKRQESYSCPYCDYKTPKPASIGGHVAGHIKRCEFPKRDGSIYKSRNPLVNVVNCKICGKPCASLHGISVHSSVMHGIKGGGNLPKKQVATRGDLLVSIMDKEDEKLDTRRVANELLNLVVSRINEDKVQQTNEIIALKSQILNLEGLNKKVTEERDQVIRAHNEIIQESKVKLPTVESVLSALRREHVGGKPL